MNKKALFVGHHFIFRHHHYPSYTTERGNSRTLPGSQQIAQTHTAAATAGPKEEAEEI